MAVLGRWLREILESDVKLKDLPHSLFLSPFVQLLIVNEVDA